MTVRALLWTYKPRKDGKCNINIYIHKSGKKKYRIVPNTSPGRKIGIRTATD
jgi:hypothetical protein